MRPATPQDRDTRVPGIARLAAWTALCAAIGAVCLICILARPCRAQESDREIILARAVSGDERAAVEQLVTHALQGAMSDRHARREYAGVVYRIPHGTQPGAWVYRHTRPRRARREGGFSLRLRLPAGAEVLALYHTHPVSAGRQARAHSPHDVAVARELGLVSYLGVVQTGVIRCYDPLFRPQAPVDYPHGAHVGRILRSEEEIQPPAVAVAAGGEHG